MSGSTNPNPIYLQLDSRYRDSETWPLFGDYGVSLQAPPASLAGVVAVEGAPVYDEWAAMPATLDPDLLTETPTLSVLGGAVLDSWMDAKHRVLAIRAETRTALCAAPANVPVDPAVHALYSHEPAAVLFVGLAQETPGGAWAWAYTLFAEVRAVSQASLAYRPARGEMLAAALVDVVAGAPGLAWVLRRPGQPDAPQGTTPLDHAQCSLQVLAGIRFSALTGVWTPGVPSLAVGGLHRLQTRSEFGRALLAQDVSGHAYQAASWDPLAGALATAAHHAVASPDENPVVPGTGDQTQTTTTVRVASFAGNTYLWVANAAQLQVWVVSDPTAPRAVYTFVWPEEETFGAGTTTPLFDTSPIDVLVAGGLGWCAFQNGFVWHFAMAATPLGLAVAPSAARRAFGGVSEVLASASQPHLQDPAHALWPDLDAGPRLTWVWLTSATTLPSGGGSTAASSKVAFRLRLFAVDLRHGGFLVEAATPVLQAVAIKFAYPGTLIPIMLAAWPQAPWSSTAVSNVSLSRLGMLAATNIMYPYECALAYTDPVATTTPATGALLAAAPAPPPGAVFGADPATGGGIATVVQSGVYRATGYMDAAAGLWQGAPAYTPTYWAFTEEKTGTFSIDGWSPDGDSVYATDPAALTVDVEANSYQGPWTQLQAPQPVVLESYTMRVVLQDPPVDPLGGSFGFTPLVAPARVVTLGSNDGVAWTALDDYAPDPEVWAAAVAAAAAEGDGNGNGDGTVTAVVTRTIPYDQGLSPADLAQREAFAVVRQVWLATRAFTADPLFPAESYYTYADQNIGLRLGLAYTVRPRIITPAVTTVVPPSLSAQWSVPFAPAAFTNLVDNIAVATDPATGVTLAAVSAQTGAFVNTEDTNTTYTHQTMGFQVFDVSRREGRMGLVRGGTWSIPAADRAASPVPNYVGGLDWNYDRDGRWYLVVAQQTSVQWLQWDAAQWAATAARLPLGLTADSSVQTTRLALPDGRALQSLAIAVQPVVWFPTAAGGTPTLASVSYLATSSYWAAVVNCPSPACGSLDCLLPSPDGTAVPLSLFPVGLGAAAHPTSAGLYLFGVERAATAQITFFDARAPACVRRVAALDVDPSLYDAQTAWVPSSAALAPALGPGMDPRDAGLAVFGLAQPDGANGTLQWWDATQMHIDVQTRAPAVSPPTFVAQINLGPVFAATMAVLCQAGRLPGVLAGAVAVPAEVAARLAVQTPVLVTDPYYCTATLYLAIQARPESQSPASMTGVGVSSGLFAETECQHGLEYIPNTATVSQTVCLPRLGAALQLAAGSAMDPATGEVHRIMLWQAVQAGYLPDSQTWTLETTTAYGYDLGAGEGAAGLDGPRSLFNLHTVGPGLAGGGGANWVPDWYYPGQNDTNDMGPGNPPPYPNPARCQAVDHPSGTGDVLLSMLNRGVWYVWVWDGGLESPPILWSASAVADPSVQILDLVRVRDTLGVVVSTRSAGAPTRWVPPPGDESVSIPGYADLASDDRDAFTPVLEAGTDWWGLGLGLGLGFPSVFPPSAAQAVPAWTCAVNSASQSLWVGAYSRAPVAWGADPATGKSTYVLSPSPPPSPCLGLYDVSGLGAGAGAGAAGSLAATAVPQARRTTVCLPPPRTPNAAWVMSTSEEGAVAWLTALAPAADRSLADQALLGGLDVNANLTGLALSGTTPGGGGARGYVYPVGPDGVVGPCPPQPAWVQVGSNSGGDGYGSWVAALVPVSGSPLWFVRAAGLGGGDHVWGGSVRWDLDPAGGGLLAAQTVARQTANVVVYSPAGTIAAVVQSPTPSQTAQVVALSRTGEFVGSVVWSTTDAPSGAQDVQAGEIVFDPATGDWWATGWARAPGVRADVSWGARPALEIQAVDLPTGAGWFAYRFGGGGGGVDLAYRSSSVRLVAAGGGPLSSLGAAPRVRVGGGRWSLDCTGSAPAQWAAEPDGCLSLGWASCGANVVGSTWSTLHSLARTGVQTGTLSTLVVPSSLPARSAAFWVPSAGPTPPSSSWVSQTRTGGVTDAYAFVAGDAGALDRSWRVRAESGPRAEDGRVALVLNAQADTRVLGRAQFGRTGLDTAWAFYTVRVSRSPVQGVATVRVDPASRVVSVLNLAGATGTYGVRSLPPLFAAGTLATTASAVPPPPSTNVVYAFGLPAGGVGDLVAVQGDPDPTPAPSRTEVWWATNANASKFFYFAFNPSSYAAPTTVTLQVASVSLPNIRYAAASAGPGGATLPLAGLAYAYLQVFPTSAAGEAGTAVLNNFYSNTGLSSSVLTFPLNIEAGGGGSAFVLTSSPLTQTVQFDPSLTVLRLRLLDPHLRPIVFDNAADEARLFSQVCLLCTIGG